MASTAEWMEAKAVSRMTGTVGCRSLSCRNTAKPSVSGNRKSSSTRSVVSPNAASASAPVPASTTSNPWVLSCCLSVQRINCSSSTTRMVAVDIPPSIGPGSSVTGEREVDCGSPMTMPSLGHLDPARLAAAVALATGLDPAAADQPGDEALLARLGALVAASHGVLVLGEGEYAVVHAATGCPPSTAGAIVAGRTPVLGTLVPGRFADILVVNLSVRGRPLGTLDLGRAALPAFSAADRTIAELVAPRFALLIEQQRLQQAEAGARAVAVEALAALRGKEAQLETMDRAVSERTQVEAALTQSRDELVSRLSVQADALLEMQALHRAVVETIVDGVIVIDQRGRIEWTNAAALRMFDYEAAEVLGGNVRMFMASPDAERHDGYLSHYLDTGDRKVIGIGREVRGRRRDGSEFPLYLAVGETRVDGARKFTGIVRDLTVTKRLEHRLQERQTLARIGELAAVVAHEVRNPLAAIRGVVEVIQTRFPADSADRQVLGDLLVRVDSLDDLVSDLLVYARPMPPVFRRAGMLTLARDTVALVANDCRAGSVRFDVTGDEAELWLDPAQMGRALLNLMTNAAQAMRNTGVVRITGERHEGRYRLTVADEGPGMPADVVARCLEPFFTTKTRGTGLGLPIAKRVVEEHGGAFTVAAEPGAGTRVTIELPLDAAPSGGE